MKRTKLIRRVPQGSIFGLLIFSICRRPLCFTCGIQWIRNVRLLKTKIHNKILKLYVMTLPEYSTLMNNKLSSHHPVSVSRSGSPPMPSTSSSSLTNDVPKPPARDQPATRPPYTPTLGGQAPHSHQFPRTRKMFDKGPDQVEKSLPPMRSKIRLRYFLF